LATAGYNILLNDKALQMLVVLRMNRNFMVFVQENYFLEIKALQPFNIAVVVPDIEWPKGNLKRPEFFADLKSHGQRKGVDL
jgi:hypothetical protein